MNDGQHEVDGGIVEAAVAELSPIRVGAANPVKPHQRLESKTMV